MKDQSESMQPTQNLKEIEDTKEEMIETVALMKVAQEIVEVEDEAEEDMDLMIGIDFDFNR